MDGVWKPACGHEKYRVAYALLDGEVMVGGVYLRIFLKDPTFPLRDPKGELSLFTVTFCANPANDLTCPPSYIITENDHLPPSGP